VERLWSPWRLAYVTATDRPGACIFCDALSVAAPSSLVVFQAPLAYVILNLYPYNNGHLMVVPRRHVGTLAVATPDELAELMALTRRAEMALTAAYEPHGLNVGINLGKAAGAGVLDHLHIHVVPRWNGDTNFMTAVGEVRVLPEQLEDSAARLRPLFERLAQEDDPTTQHK
jgi:ATP adenylyltransferase